MRGVPEQVRGRGGSPAVAEMQARVPRGVRGHVAGRAFHVSSLPLPRGSGGHSPGGGRKAFPPESSTTTEQGRGTRAFEFGPGEAGDSGVSTEAFVRWGGGRRNNGGAAAESEVDDVV